MLIEPGVFYRQDRVDHDLGYVLQARQVAPLFTKLADQNTLFRKNAQRQDRAVVRQLGDIG